MLHMKVITNKNRINLALVYEVNNDVVLLILH